MSDTNFVSGTLITASWLNDINDFVYTTALDLVHESSGTDVLTLTGCSTSPTGTARYVKQGNVVTLYIPTITGTSTTSAATLTGLDASLWPARDQSVLARVANGASGTVLGLFQVLTTGDIALAADVGGAAFNTSGTKGIYIQTLTYSLA